jgi:hypothetical protein
VRVSRTIRAVGATALLGTCVALFIVGLGRADRSTTYRIRPGDYINIPALDWTCAETVLTKGGAPVLACDTNDKPISGVIIESRQIVIHAVSKLTKCPFPAAAVCAAGAARAPARSPSSRYVFHYSHD